MDSYGRSYGVQHQSGNQRPRFNNMQPHWGFVPPSLHTSTPFMPPQMHVPLPPFTNSFMYPAHAAPAMNYFQDATPIPIPDPFRFLPLIPRPDLDEKIITQIDYYFSKENLAKDVHLRQNMDEQGWVSVYLIAGFNRISSLTNNVRLILDVMRASTTVEVKGEKMRRRDGWMKWPPIPRSLNVESLSSRSECYGGGLEVKGVGMVFIGQPWLK
ncbi:hypothetical protein LXL04_024683 [Taraxacum kok-saghyz]